MIALEDAVVRKRGIRILGPVNHRFEGTGITAVIGPNGAGKTTLLRLCHGLERVAAGRVLRDDALKRAFVFQTPTIMRRSALDNAADRDVARAVAAMDGRCTVLIIGHRGALTECASRTVTLESGRIVADTGSP